jgi:23S rRNA (uracil-5-)-methyltransferase RumA
VLHTVNDDTGERVEARAGLSRVVDGKERITEVLHGLAFDISMSSFFQTNPQCAERLYAEVVNAVMHEQDRLEGEVVMDLFCGTGTIAQLLAQATGRRVIGVDLVESAIEDARVSAARNGNENIEFYAADVGKFLLDYPEYVGRIRTIVLDPPRAGISPKTLRKVMRLDAPRIVYVSCNPATQARDLKTLAEWGYALQSFKLVDQFPHTAHVESVAVFEKTLRA